MKIRFIAVLSLVILLSCSAFNTYGQTYEDIVEAARLRLEEKEKQRQEESRYNSANNSRSLSVYDKFIADYPNSKYTPEIRRQAAEVRLWNNAKSANTVSAYEKYLSSTKFSWYESAANNSIEILRQNAEKQAWDKVVNVGTIDAYKKYLADNPDSGYKKEAENAINRLEAEQVWSSISGTTNLPTLRYYIQKYPHADNINSVKRRYSELVGISQCNNGDMESAYESLSKLDYYQLSAEGQTAYNAAKAWKAYSRLSSYSSESDLKAFLRDYPNSRYTDEVNNMIAIVKAKALDEYSSDYDYTQARGYIRDSYTRQRVEEEISRSKSEKKARDRMLRSWERERNGGTFNLGFDFTDFGVCLNSSGDTPAMYYNIGLMLRVGNYADRVQFAIGVKPGLTMYDYYGMEYGFHMPAVAQLKLNLFKMSENSRFFVFGQYQYNAIRQSDMEGEMSWAAGLGFAWKRVDWSFYFRQDIGETDSYDTPAFFGMSMIYYWQL